MLDRSNVIEAIVKHLSPRGFPLYLGADRIHIASKEDFRKLGYIDCDGQEVTVIRYLTPGRLTSMSDRTSFLLSDPDMLAKVEGCVGSIVDSDPS